MPTANVSSHGSTAMPPSSPSNVISGQPLPKTVAQEGVHSHAGRLFVGPMPMKVVAPVAAEKDNRGESKHLWLTFRKHEDVDNGDAGGDEAEEVVPEGHAFRYFLQLGGHEDDWGSQASLRRRTKSEMLRKWKQSGWDATSRPQSKGNGEPKKWVGQTFQIGIDFLGVPMPTSDDAKPSKSRSLKSRSSRSLRSPDPTSSPEASTSKTFSASSYCTARARRSISPSGESSAPSSSDTNHRDSRYTNGSGVALLPKDEALGRRRTVSLPRMLSLSSGSSKAMTDGQIRGAKTLSDHGDAPHPAASDTYMPVNINSSPLRSALRRYGGDDGKGKAVQFSAVTHPREQPAPPAEVLSRRPSKNLETSDGAATTHTESQVPQHEAVRYGDIFLSDRMLVRRSHAKSGIGSYFDAKEAKKVRDIINYDWKEYLVVWRKDQLELYESYSVPCKESILGHKHLAFVIPLQKPDTKLSLYSFTDFTFCLTCTTLHVAKDQTRTASSLSTMIHFHRDSGTDIFVFKAKTRSSSIDWTWNIWRWLGNRVPTSFDVYCPATDYRVRLQIPEFDRAGGEGYKIFTRDHVVEQCRAALKHIPSWNFLIEEPISRGASLELCWRKETMLDWIRWYTDTDGNARDWEVMYGICLGKPQEITHLEARIAEHHPTSLSLNDGTHLREPPAVEGYLYRIKSFSQSRAQVYLSSHSGCLFLIGAGHAQPPRPPIPVEDAIVEDDDTSPSLNETEAQRGTKQILKADVFIDLRSIVTVRRAFQVSVTSQQPNVRQGSDTLPSQQTAAIPEEGDEGGDEALARHPNKSELKMRRSFELLMRTGNVVRFEAFSCAVALEWIDHLTHLVEYWKHKHRANARQEMELMRAVTGGPSVVLETPEKALLANRPSDYDHSSEYLPSFWNWCVLDGCSSVIKYGRLYLKRAIRGQYKLMQFVLVSGHLIQFHVTHGMAHHLRSKTTSLFDAYICSGHFALQALTADEFSVNQDPLPRRFQDALETDDPEADKMFIVLYRQHAIGKASAHSEPKKNAESTIPPLNSKRKILVLKARSKLERNAWCWALNAEMERISRRFRVFGAKVRDADLKLVKH